MNTLVVANWKMNPATSREAKALFEGTKKIVDSVKGISVVVAPPALYLRELKKMYKGKRITFAAQHAHFEDRGAHTGDISMAMMRDAGATYVLIGHGERRQLGESNEDIRQKINTALNLKLTPILCVGERERIKEADHFHVVREQLRVALRDVVAPKLKQVIIMYEPLWAVGSGNPVSPRDMHEMSIFIKKMLVEQFGDTGLSMRILYGGSVNNTNAKAMIDEAGVQGFVVGGASIDYYKFKALLESLE